jgi:hypothetical protein
MATRSTIRTRVNRNIGNISSERFSLAQVNESIQKGYNLATVLSGSIQKSTSFPFPSDTPYINLRAVIPDYFATLGIFNTRTARWVEPTDVKSLNNMRWDWERWTGEPTNCWFPVDFNRICILPYQTTGVGSFILWYLGSAPTLTDSSALELPDTYHSTLEDYGSADLLDLDREYGKAALYYESFYSDLPKISKIVNNLAAYDKNLVLEPYFPLGRYGGSGIEEVATVAFADNIIPSGTQDGVNPTFTLPSAPNPAASLFLQKNGQMLYPGVGYTLSGFTITFSADYIPTANDLLRAWYRT